MPVVMYFPKYSKLHKVFNRELLHYMEVGLLNHWTAEYTQKSSFDNKYNQQVPEELKIENISGIMEICLVLLVFVC